MDQKHQNPDELGEGAVTREEIEREREEEREGGSHIAPDTVRPDQNNLQTFPVCVVSFVFLYFSVVDLRPLSPGYRFE